MARRLLTGILLLVTLSLLASAQEVPLVVQPQRAGYSPAQLAALDEAITQLKATLRNSNLGSKEELGGAWTFERFAGYTAGSLERLGYQAAIVSRQVGESESKVWVVVRIDLDGAIAWIPVDPLPDADRYQSSLGEVPLVSALIYDSSYLSYDAIVELPPNLPPVAAIRNQTVDIVETKHSAWFGNASSDPDGEIVLFQWTFGEDVQRITHTISQWYVFDVGGMDYPVSLTVTDNRGARATTSISVYVLTLAEEEAKNCGCGG